MIKEQKEARIQELSCIMPPVFTKNDGKSSQLLQCDAFLHKHDILTKVLEEAKQKSAMFQALSPQVKRVWYQGIWFRINKLFNLSI